MSPRAKNLIIKTAIFLAMEVVLFLSLWIIKPTNSLSVHVSVFDETWTFMNPQMFWGILVSPVLVLLPSLSDMSIIQKALMIVMRSLLITLVIFALARPVTVVEDRKVSITVLVDISSSIGGEQLKETDRILKTIVNKNKNHGAQLNIVTFDEHQNIFQDKTKNKYSGNEKLRQKTVEQTNIEKAINFGLSLISPGYDNRMVLISDGLETEGNALSISQDLQSMGIPVYYYFPGATPRPEVFISSFLLPHKVNVKQPFELTASFVSNVETKAKIYLYQGTSPEEMFKNDLDFYREIDLKIGENIQTFKGQVNELGVQAFKLILKIPDKKKDTEQKNNESWAVLVAKDKPRILYIEGNQSQGRYFLNALKSGDLEVEMRSSWGFPASLTQMKRYSCIIQSDVPATYLSTGKMMLLSQYVKGGGCYIMTGGENAFGSGGYYQTPIEKLLPVRFDLEKNRRQPAVAMVLVIDRSGSMMGEKMRLAKEAAAVTANMLGSRDLLGVIAFDHRPQVVVELTYAANRSRIEQLIRKIRADGGTEIVSGLESANTMLCDARAKIKHVILLSDGQSGRDRLEDVLQEARQCGITISVIGIGSDVDKGMLELIKERAQGRSYYTTDPHDLPRLFTKEASKVARPPLVDEPVKTKIVKNVEFLRGIDIEKAPYLLGYVPTKIKKKAELILKSDIFGEPLLARWNVGIGKSIAFTSDIKARWARQWIESWSSGFQKFWTQLVRDSIRLKKLEEYSMTVSSDGPWVHVYVDAVSNSSKWRNLLDSKLSIDEFGGKKARVLDMKQKAPGRYEVSFKLPRHGTYLLTSKHYCSPETAKKAGEQCPGAMCPCSSKTLIGESWGSASYGYSKEVRKVQPDGNSCKKMPEVCEGLKLLIALSGATSGKELDKTGMNDLFREGTKVEKSYQERWKWFFWPFLILMILDILSRRIRIFGFRYIP
ncbi:MAG: VWA domain-containing protein [Deltaproteobacteria bacterium]|nr:VWA domain-containing protein [Deltaproteobacteria bacterium]